MSASGNTTEGTDEQAAILNIIGDEACRELLCEAKDQPRTARELADQCNQSRSTVYRKLERLREKGLVDSEKCIRFDSKDTTKFTTELRSITANLEQGSGFSIDRNPE